MTIRSLLSQPDFPPSLTSPARRRTFDRFELRRELGSGVTGVVWQAWDRQRTADVALKILHRFDSALVRRFKQEFRTLADVRHRNIVRFHELFEIEDRLFFSMELIDGVDVLAWVWGYRPADAAPRADEEDTAPFDEDTKPNVIALAGPKVDYARLRDCFAQLVRGLAHLHAAGYLHRDLKPSNLMVRRDGRLMILDFGLAVSLLAPLGGELEAAVGTIAYMAPEVVEQRTADARTDYYSLGVLLFEAITGRLPFCGDHPSEVLTAKATREAPRPSSLVPGVPEDLDQLCFELLQRDPATRAGAGELARVFLEGGAELPAAVPRDGAAPGPHSGGDRTARGSGPVTRPPVVGRGREVERLRADLESVSTSGLQCRLVTGPSGIGKSAFAEELARTLTEQAPPATVLRGRCHDREAIAFRAIDQVVDALAQHLAGLPAAERARLTPPRAHLLGELFPALRGLSGEHVRLRPRDPGVLRLAAFACLRELLTALAQTAPLAVMIDDLHLADPDSLDLIAQVFLGAEAPPLLFIGLGRPGAVLDQLGRLAAASGSGGERFGRFELGPLQGEQAEQVARALARYMDIDLPDASSVAMDTRGHPGFTFDILRAGAPLAGTSRRTARGEAAAEPGDFPRDITARDFPSFATGSDLHSLTSLEPLDAAPPGDAGFAPPSFAADSLPALASVLTTRILALDEPARRMIELLCAIDGPCSVQLAADLLDLGLGDIAAALDDLVDADLVVATGRADDDAFELYHERIRDVAEATLGDDTFAAINRTLAEALEQRGDADPARLLRHWQLGGDRVRAAHYRSMLAAKAVAALELQRAALYHETSLREELPLDVERGIRTALGEIYGFLGRQVDSANQLLAASSLASGETALELRCRAATVLLQAAEVEAGSSLIEDVLEELGCAPPPRAAGVVSRADPRADSGAVASAEASAPAGGPSAPSPRRIHGITGAVSSPAGRAGDASAAGSGVIAGSLTSRLATRLRNALPARLRRRRTSAPFHSRAAETVPRRQSLLLDALATASISVGVLQPLRGRAYQQRHLEVARQVGDRTRFLRALGAEAAWAACAGTAARPAVEETLAAAAAAAPAPMPARVRGELELVTAIAEFHLGDFERARRAVDKALAALESDSAGAQLGAQFELRQARSYASWIAWMTGDYATLGRRTPQWAAQARELGDRFSFTLLTTGSSIAAWLLADDVATAERQLEEAERTWDEVDAPVQRWLIAVARVQLELYRGAPAAARAALEPALAAARRAGLHQVETLYVGMIHLELRTRLALAAAAPRLGAEGHLERALHLERAGNLRRLLAACPAPWARALAALAAATCLEHAGHADPARRAYRTAERALRAAGLVGYAAAAAWSAAALAPSLPTLAEAGEEISQAHLAAVAAAQGILVPERFYAFLVGG